MTQTEKWSTTNVRVCVLLKMAAVGPSTHASDDFQLKNLLSNFKLYVDEVVCNVVENK